jgi:hypothetical protein
MAKTKKPDGGKAIIDVAHPGKSAPSANSKSVIVGNRPLLKDPMMVDEPNSQSYDSTDSSLAKVSNKSGVQPLTAPLLETEKPDETNTPPEAAKPSEENSGPSLKAIEAVEPDKTLPEAEDETVADQQSAADQSAEPPKPAETPDDKADGAADDGPDDHESEAGQPQPKESEKPDQSDQPAPSKPETKPAETNGGEPTPQSKDKAKQTEAEADQETKRQAAIDKLTDNKKYYLPINAVEKRRSRRFVILGIILSLLLILAWADIALDSGLIHINGIKPLTHFFSN